MLSSYHPEIEEKETIHLWKSFLNNYIFKHYPVNYNPIKLISEQVYNYLTIAEKLRKFKITL